jgi:hypothetical protein
MRRTRYPLRPTASAVVNCILVIGFTATNPCYIPRPSDSGVTCVAGHLDRDRRG